MPDLDSSSKENTQSISSKRTRTVSNKNKPQQLQRSSFSSLLNPPQRKQRQRRPQQRRHRRHPHWHQQHYRCQKSQNELRPNVNNNRLFRTSFSLHSHCCTVFMSGLTYGGSLLCFIKKMSQHSLPLVLAFVVLFHDSPRRHNY